jgi:hypothetical protein
MTNSSIGAANGALARSHLLLSACVALFAMLALCAPARAQEAPVPKAYEPYAFLIGKWDIGPEGRTPVAITQFRWGPKKTYIWYSGGLLANGKEQPNFEGLLVWNGVRHNLDMLLVLDLNTGDLVQEQGSVSVEADGSVVRDITVYYSEGNALPPDWKRAAGPEGATARFRHSFKQIGPGRVRTSIMRKTDDGWVPSFRGSDALIMVKRSDG